MKDGYRYQDGKVFVTDYSNGMERDVQIRHYQDNIEEILITENILEKLNSEYNKLIDIYNQEVYNLENEKSIIPMAFLCILMITFLFGGVLSLLLFMVGIKPLITLILFFITSLGLTYKFSIKGVIEEVKEMKRILKSYDFTIESIEKEIDKQQDKLKKLEDNITRDKLDTEDMNRVQRGEYIQIDYVDKLRELREYLGLCYAVGYLQEGTNEYSEEYMDERINGLSKGLISNENVKTLKRKFMDRMEDR